MNQNLQSAKSIALAYLTKFAKSDNFWQDFESAFGHNYDRQIALNIQSQLAGDTFTAPKIVVVDGQILGTANGAFATENNTIYISSYFLENSDVKVIAATLIEEIGHSIDAKINTQDSAGDEGQLFSALVRGEHLTSAQLAGLKAENDHAVITIDGQLLSIEKQDYTGTSAGETLTATSGTNTLAGLGGNDTLIGGSGADTFVFGGVGFSSIASIGLDTISTFVVGTDKIKLHKSTFGTILAAASASIGTDFVSVADDTFVDSQTAAIVYSRASGGLFYNSNGTTAGYGTNGGQFATLYNKPTALSATDFLIVDNKVNLSISTASVLENGTPNLVYTFTRSDLLNTALTVGFNIGGTATLGTDYTQSGAASFTGTTGTVTFAAGVSSVTVTIDPTQDTTVENDETVALTLTSVPGYVLGTIAPVVGTIVNDDNSTVTLAVTPATVTEDGATNLVYTFTRADSIKAVTVNYTVSGTATFGTDYTQAGAATFTATTGTVTFAAGKNTAVVTINPTGDTTYEALENIALTLVSGTGYNIGTATSISGTITNDDLLPAISIADTTIVEGINGAPSQALITISLNRASYQTVTVKYSTGALTAISGIDYTPATNTTVTFVAGQTSQIISVPILNDNLNEANETFEINLTTPTNATILDSKAIVTITDTFATNITSTLAPLVENLTLTGASAINGTGNTGANVLTGNAGNNALAGLDGNDTYLYDADSLQGTDTINEVANTGGIDTLDLSQTAAAVNINLGLTTTQTVNKNLKLVIPVISLENFIGGGGNDRITGNTLANTLDGGIGDDRIFGGANNDILSGQSGNDIIGGGDGNDILTGGAGSDILTGGAGNDTFAYNGLLSGAITATALFGIDTISDFTTTQDKISVSKATFSAITSAVGAAIGSNFITVNDDSLVAIQSAAIVYSSSSGSLFYNQNGSTAGYGTNGGEFASLLGSPTLVAADFTVVA